VKVRGTPFIRGLEGRCAHKQDVHPLAIKFRDWFNISAELNVEHFREKAL
jgi:hypothetical protein